MKDDSKWCCKVEDYMDKYSMKWLLTAHSKKMHSLRSEKGKLGCLSTYPKSPRWHNHVAMNVKEQAKGRSSYENHCYSKVGLIVKDCRRPRGGQKTSFIKGCLVTFTMNFWDSSLGVWWHHSRCLHKYCLSDFNIFYLFHCTQPPCFSNMPYTKENGDVFQRDPNNPKYAHAHHTNY